MKNKITFVIILLFGCLSGLPGQTELLTFNTEGKFKIIQFTDIHYRKEDKGSAVAIRLIKEALDAEKPDLVVFTGDVIWAEPVLSGLDDVFNPVIERNIPWAYVFGNHDDEFGVSRDEIMEYVVGKPYCLAQKGDKSIKGVGNYVLEIKDKLYNTTKSVLYFMDSGSYSPVKGVGSYDWFSFNQVEWYRNRSEVYTGLNGGIPFPGLAFFHIPLPEYAIMKADEKAFIAGHKDETECNGVLNTGMFAAMRESGDVMGVFVGHDHDNDYIGMYYDIALAYGRYSGGKTVYNNLGLNGCRIIELSQGKREFSTYIRLLGGEKIFQVKYPEDMMPQKEIK